MGRPILEGFAAATASAVVLPATPSHHISLSYVVSYNFLLLASGLLLLEGDCVGRRALHGDCIDRTPFAYMRKRLNCAWLAFKNKQKQAKQAKTSKTSKNKQKQAKQADNDNDNENENVNENVDVNDRLTDRAADFSVVALSDKERG